jgi:hypothetical protein
LSGAGASVYWRPMSAPDSNAPLHYASPLAAGDPSSPLISVGGVIGIGANVVGLAVLLAACFGLNGAFVFSWLVLVLGVAGLIITVVGGIVRKPPEDTHVVAALFINVFAIVGGLLEVAVHANWTVFLK